MSVFKLLQPPTRESMGGVESANFSASVNTASGLRQFLLAVKDDSRWMQLNDLSTRDLRLIHEIDCRIVDLLDSQQNPQFEHEYDAAIAAYLILLRDRSPVTAMDAAQRILRIAQEPNRAPLFWSRRIAEQIVDTFADQPIRLKPRHLAARFIAVAALFVLYVATVVLGGLILCSVFDTMLHSLRYAGVLVASFAASCISLLILWALRNTP